MKGFIYLLEITVAMILILVVLATISSFRSSENWERSDLLDSARYVSDALNGDDIRDFLANDTEKIDTLVPKNIRYALSISGVAKANISVGCVNGCNFVRGILTPSYVNGRWVNFSVFQFDPEVLNYIPQYDAIILVNYTRYTQRKANITSYLRNGGTVIGINGTYSNANSDFNDMFGLTASGSAVGDFGFSSYDPSSDETEKYFMYTGFNVNTSNTAGGKKWGSWYIWNVARTVSINSAAVDVENKTVDEGLIQGIPEGGYFRLKSPINGKFYSFKVSKIFWDSSVTLQPMNSSFVFGDFSDSAVRGKFDIIRNSSEAEMASNGSSVWISDFPQSDEYNLLVKSAIISRAKSYDASRPDATKKYVAFSSFYSMCCEVPEIAKLTLYLWYKV
jgi:hypothetical protein